MSYVREIQVMGRRREHSPGERTADACVHAIGILAGLTGAVFLARMTQNSEKLPAILVYAGGLVAMLSASAAYNVCYHTHYRGLFRRFDHSAIFLMIAGTYTPFTTSFFTGTVAWSLTGLIWALAFCGIAIKVFRAQVFERFSVILYLALGWISLLVIGPLLTTMSLATGAALLGGGILYTGGMTFHLWEDLPYQNAIWHVFVLAAALCHYAAVLNGVVLPA